MEFQGLSTAYLHDSLCRIQNFLLQKEYVFAQTHSYGGRLVMASGLVLDVALETLKILDLVEQVAFIALHFVASFFSNNFSRDTASHAAKELPAAILIRGVSLLFAYILTPYCIYQKFTEKFVSNPFLYCTKEMKTLH